jgi:ribonuclease BN (tRNA processing enzyme)
MAKVRVGLVGCGFVAELHMYAYRRVYGVDADVTAVAARGHHVLESPRSTRSARPIAISTICSPTRRSTSSTSARAGTALSYHDIEITADRVDHIPAEISPCYGFHIEAEGKVVAFSGDTAPYAATTAFSRGRCRFMRSSHGFHFLAAPN